MKTFNKILILFVIMITCVPMYVAACNQLTDGEYNPLKLTPLKPGSLWISKETVSECNEFKNFLAIVKFCEQYNIKVCDFKKLCAKNSSVEKNQSVTMSGGQASDNSGQPKIEFNLNLKPHQQILKIAKNDSNKLEQRQNWVDEHGYTYGCFLPNSSQK